MRLSSRKTASLLLFALAMAPSLAKAQIEEPRIPLQTKLTELNRFREEYAQAYNKKDVAALMAMYSPDIIVTDQAGATMKGLDAVKNYFTAAGANLPHLVIESDSLAVYGNTAVDVGTSKMHPAAGGEEQSRYLVVLRRGMNMWKVVRVALTPVAKGQ